MMLVMIAEMEAGQERRQGAIIVAPRPVTVAERLRAGAVGEEGPEQEKLKRGKDRRKRPEEQQVRIVRFEQQDVDGGEPGQDRELAPPER